MQFVHQWFPLIVTVREGSLDSLELDELYAGFEGYFRRAEPYAVLSAALPGARAPDAMARMRLAEWANQPRIRRCSKDLCAGSATVVARAWERHALTALQWLWTPVFPHQAVSRVGEGIGFCIERLLERNVKLPAPAATFGADVSRGLCALGLAGTNESTDSQRRRAPDSSRAPPLQTLTDGEGSISIGWVAPGVLWASFRGRVNEPVCEAYAALLGELLKGCSGVRYFVDTSQLESLDLLARRTALRALSEQQQHFLHITLSEWAGGVSPTSRATFQALGSVLQLLNDAAEFEAQLLAAAPSARELIAREHRETEIQAHNLR